MVVSPKGEVLVNMHGRFGMETVEFDPKDKYYKSAGFGNKDSAHYQYIEYGRKPWLYRNSGPSMVKSEGDMKYPRVCAHRGFNTVAPENSMPAFGAAVALGAEEIEFVMGTLGFRMNDSSAQSNQEIFTTSRRGVVAKGVYSGESFDVLPGSEIDINRAVNIESYNAKRQECLRDGTITETDGKYYLNKIISFRTPSGASDFVLGGSTNGWVEWKDANGKTLDSIFRSN